jgi:hypothetical protein
MELQVITDRPVKTLRIGRNRIRFIVNKHTNKIPKQSLKTPHGPVWISTPGATAVDIVRFHKKSAGYSHIATVLLEMGKKIESQDLVKVANIYNEAPLIQRVGYFLETYVKGARLATLHSWLKNQNCSYKRLSGKRSGPELSRNSKWYIVVDIEVEPDEV